MTDKSEGRRKSADAVDRVAVMRSVMEVLAVKGFDRVSMRDLSSAAGMNAGALRTAFGNREHILRSAVQFCADTEASLAQESLQVSPSAREALLSMLEENVRLRRHWPRSCGCLFTFNGLVVPPDDVGLQESLAARRHGLSKQIRLRFAQAVIEGELSEGADVEAITNLSFILLSGVTSRILDGISPKALFRTIELFVDALGFGVRGGRGAQKIARAPGAARAGRERTDLSRSPTKPDTTRKEQKPWKAK